MNNWDARALAPDAANLNQPPEPVTPAGITDVGRTARSGGGGGPVTPGAITDQAGTPDMTVTPGAITDQAGANGAPNPPGAIVDVPPRNRSGE
ncbi:MAG TPA: hypothetical protein V6D47_06385 [Oscillatoriaceae cyanobacterium]